MNWNPLSSLIGRKNEEPAQLAKCQEISRLIQVYDFRVTAPLGAMVPPDLAERLTNLITAAPDLSKRDVVLTGLARILDICERTPTRPVPELKLGTFKCRGQTSLGFRAPLDVDRRLTQFISSLPGISKRDVIVAGLDLILTECETINGGPFPPADIQAASRERGRT
jgi:hypothetical protein